MEEYHHCSWHGVGCIERYVNENITENVVTEIILPSSGMSGELPSQLGTLNELKILRLFNNQLRGTIPDFYSNSLEELWLQDNQISGTVPQSLTNLANLKQLRLDSNRLTGSLPSGLGDPDAQPNLQM